MTSTDLHHTVRDGRCTVCGEFEFYLIEEGIEFERLGEDDALPMSGVRNDDEHTLTVDRTLDPGAKEERHFLCTCGEDFGTMYDSPARRVYRAHRKAAGH